MRPGTRLRALANRVCSPTTMERVIDPLIADMQCEHEQAVRGGRTGRGRWIVVTGHVAFMKAIALHMPSAAGQRLRGFVAPEREAVGRAIAGATVTMIVMTALLIALPFRHLPVPDGRMAWLVLLLVPQSLPFTVPFGLFAGVLCGWRGRRVSSRLRHVILVAGLAGSLTMLGNFQWLLPAANQAFRVTVAGRDLPKGQPEMRPGALRERALAMRRDGRLGEAGNALFAYHVRWALAGAALVFALFALGVTALRTGPAATVAIFAIAFVVCVEYFAELGVVRPAVFSDERLALVLAWLPNLLLAITAVPCLSARDEARRADPVT